MHNNFLSLLLTQTWQIAALAMIVAVVVKFAAKNRPHLAHALWILVLIKCVTPPFWGHSLGVFSQMQTLIGDDSGVPTVDAESIVALPVLPAEVIQSEEPIVVEAELVPLTDSQLPQEDIAFDPELDVEQSEIATIHLSPTDQEFVSDDSTAQSASVSWSTIMLWTVVFGAISTLLVTVVRCVRALRLIFRHRTTEFDDVLNERLQQLATQLRIRRVPRIVVSDVLFGPAVLGLLRHTIVLPRCLLSRSFLPERTSVEGQTDWGGRGWTERSEGSPGVSGYRPPTPATLELPSQRFLDPILAHELLHIRRGDLSFGMLQVIAQCLWWFHPAVWFANRWLSREAERCCDEQVIAELGCSPGQYARSLLAVIESKHALQPIPVFPGMKPVEITTQRMERIMSLKTGLNKRSPLWCWLAVIALAIVVLPGAVATTSAHESVGDEASAVQDTVTTTETNKNVTVPATAEDETAQLTARIRLADDFIPSSEMDLKGKSVIAFVDEKPIAVDEIVDAWVMAQLEQDTYLSIEQKRALLMQLLTQRLPDYLYEEVFFVHFANELTESQRAKIVESLAPHFAEMLEKIRIDKGAADMEELEKSLLGQGFSVADMRNTFNRRQIVVGYIESLPAESPLRDKDAIERHCRQLLFEARLRKKVTLSFDNTPLTKVLQSLESEHCVSICRKAMFLFDTPAVVTARIHDQPLLDAIKAIIDPNLLQVSVGREEIVIASTPNQKNGPTSQTSRIIGAVRVPGIYVFDADKDWTILDALRLAGGLSDDAGKTITVTRKNDEGNDALIQCDLVEVAEGLDSNILLAPGDVVVVERAEDDAVAVKPNATEADRLILCTYPVADLVVTGPYRLIPVGIKEKDAQTELNRDPSNAGILRQVAKSTQALPRTGDPKFAEVTMIDFAPIVEFIKASVEPESWEDKGTIAVEIETKSLVIRQTQKAHDEIIDLIMQLRNGQDTNVQFTSLLVKLTNEIQLNVIEQHSTLQSFADGMKWALLAPKRSETLTKALLDQKPETISSPRIVTTSGQAAMIMVGSIDKSVFSGLKLTVTPQLVPDSSIIRLQHTFSIVPGREPDKSESDTYVNAKGVTISGFGHEFGTIPHESLVGSGQTLLLLIEQPRPDDDAKSVDRYVLMLTPEHVVEEEQRLDGGKVEIDPVYRKPSGRTGRKPEFTPVVPR